MEAADKNVVQCPDCGAANAAGTPKCWLCGADVAAGQGTAPDTAHEPPQFGLSSLLLIVTLVCVCLGLASIAPGLIVPLVVIVLPALIRTMSASQRSLRRGKEMTIGDKIGAFFTSLAIIVLIVVAGAIAFATACLAGLGLASSGPYGPGRGTEMEIVITFSVIGVIGGLVLMLWLFVKTWPGKR